MPVKTRKLRLFFACGGILILAAEIYIGLYVRDAFIRPYLGDTLVVILLYCLIRTVFPTKYHLLSAAVFLFAVLVEISQIFPLCDILRIRNTLIRTLMGTSFAWGDIFAYLAGNIGTGFVDLWLWRRFPKG